MQSPIYFTSSSSNDTSVATIARVRFSRPLPIFSFSNSSYRKSSYQVRKFAREKHVGRVSRMIITTRLFEVTSGQMPPRDVGASRSSQCDWRDSRSSPFQFVRTAIPSTQPVLFHPPAPSLSLGHPCMCVPASLSPLLYHESISIYFPSFSLSYRILSIYLIPCVMHFPPSSLEIFPILFSLFLYLFPPFFFLLTLSFYLPLSTPISLFLFVAPSHFSLLALSHASPSVPQQPSRHWPGERSREHQLGQSCAE